MARLPREYGPYTTVYNRFIRSVGAKLFFLPKYSPDLYPIEWVFTKLKHFPRKAAARTIDAVCVAIAKTPQAFKADECASVSKLRLSNLSSSGFRFEEMAGYGFCLQPALQRSIGSSRCAGGLIQRIPPAESALRNRLAVLPRRA